VNFAGKNQHRWKQIHYSEATGLTLGSMVTVSELAETPVIKQKFSLF